MTEIIKIMKYILFLLLFVVFGTNGKSQEKMKVIYVYDALCGWCYGFSPVMNQFHETYKDSASFEVISGGMITGNRVGPIGEVAPYISWAYKEVEKATGVQFGDTFINKTLKDGKAIFSSIPPAVALSVFKSMDTADRSLQFASQLQHAIYFDGIEPEETESYGEIASDFGFDSAEFITKIKDSVYLQLAQKDFQFSQTLQVSGFPMVFVKIRDVYYKIGSGYLPYEQLENNYLFIKNKEQ